MSVVLPVNAYERARLRDEIRVLTLRDARERATYIGRSSDCARGVHRACASAAEACLCDCHDLI